MKAILVLGMFVSVSLTVVGQVNLAAPRTVKDYGNLPVAFEANQGQTDAQVRYLSRGLGYTLFLTSTEAVHWHRVGFRRQCLHRWSHTINRFSYQERDPAYFRWRT
jgi:hypothetical protein